jgi:hypothetical protein
MLTTQRNASLAELALTGETDSFDAGVALGQTAAKVTVTSK